MIVAERLKKEVLAVIKNSPGIKFTGIRNRVGPHGYRELDRTLQKLRKAGEVEYRNGWYLS